MATTTSKKTAKAKPKKAKLTILDTLSDKVIADTVRSLPPKEREMFEAMCLGRALLDGEITIPDGKDLPPAIRKANLARIKEIPDAKVRRDFLKGGTVVIKPKRRARATA